MSLSRAGTDDASAMDTYVSRLSDAEIKCYTDGYRRICRVESSGASATPPSSSLHRSSSSNNSNNVTAESETANGLLLSKKLFRNKVLGAFTMIPHSLSDRLFDVLDTERSGELSPMNVLRGLAWLKHGTVDEKVQLLFTIYDVEGADEISREMMDRFMDVIYGRMRARHGDTVKFLDRIFNGRSTMNFYEFQQIVQQKDERGDALLVKWLDVLAAKIGMEDDLRILELEKTYNPIVIRRRIAKTTLFSLTEVTVLERQFQKMFDPKGGASTRISRSQFVEVLSAKGLFPKELLERFCACTAIQDLVLFEEFCQFLSDFCRGVSIQKKMHYLFHIYSDRSTTMRVDLDAMKDLIHVGINCDTSHTNVQAEEERQIEEVTVDCWSFTVCV